MPGTRGARGSDDVRRADHGAVHLPNERPGVFHTGDTRPPDTVATLRNSHELFGMLRIDFAVTGNGVFD
ncbi:hypothetical protein GCM10010317_008010 [Streptomyces mirabilis]|nr:hypothetical protein GCM10010317_008010 [Streptomyces mirabilis]